MAKNLLQKLNTLFQSTVQDAVQSATRPIANLRPGKNPEHEIAAIRNQFAVAEQEEAKLLQQQSRLNEEIIRMDEQADAAVQAGRDAEARHLIQQLETRKQQIAMLNSELGQLRMAMSDFLRQVNDLEARITAAKNTESPISESAAAPQPARKIEVEVEPAAQVSDKPLRIEIVQETPVDEAVVEQDLAARRARLAKPGD